MSGGYFNYDQYTIEHTAEDIDKLIRKNRKGPRIYNADTIKHFVVAARTLRRASKMVGCIDLLISGDTNEGNAWDNWPK
jgi:hypothetical protein